MDTLVKAIRAEVEADFAAESTGHDISHLDRVRGLTEHLREREGGDALILCAAAYVHDYHRVIERNTQSYGPRIDRATIDELISRVLAAAGLPERLVPAVCDCVAFTDRYSFSGHDLRAPTIEAKILRDADNLDAIGAIGIARAFMFGAVLGEPIWVEDVEPSERYEAGATTSIVHHFHEKLLRVRDDMLTDAGRELADERHRYMVGFLETLRAEWDFSALPSDTTAQTG